MKTASRSPSEAARAPGKASKLIPLGLIGKNPRATHMCSIVI
jgi:hypothetical protein